MRAISVLLGVQSKVGVLLMNDAQKQQAHEREVSVLAQAMLRRPDAKQRNLDSITACSGFVRLNRLKLEHKESP